MPEYQLQIKQVVDYPRCRIYREFIHKLINDRSIRINGGSGLFHFTVLCSYANFRTSYRHIDGISYTVSPGEWVCTVKELSCWFRTRFHRQALSMLDTLQKQHLISYTLLGRGNVVKYKILHWARHNSALEYNAPCQKDTGFFFLPVSVALELVSSARCSEMDIVLDLWVSAVYNDTQVQGSEVGPVPLDHGVRPSCIKLCRLQFRDAGHHRCVCQWGCGADYLDFGSHPGLELPKTSVRGSRTVCAARCTGLHGSCGFFYGRQPDHSKHLEILVPDAWRSNFPIGHERLVPAPVHKHGGVLPCEPAFVVRRSYP